MIGVNEFLTRADRGHCVDPSSHQMAREQKVCNALLDRIFVPAVSAYELPTLNRCLHEEDVQVFEYLRGLSALCSQGLGDRRFVG